MLCVNQTQIQSLEEVLIAQYSTVKMENVIFIIYESACVDLSILITGKTARTTVQTISDVLSLDEL